MRIIKLKLKPYQIRTLPSGGWIVCDYQTGSYWRSPYTSNFSLIKSDGSVVEIGRGLALFSKKRNELCVSTGQAPARIIWSESGKAESLTGFVNHHNSPHYANGIFVCTSFDLNKTIEKFEQNRGMHRKNLFNKTEEIAFALMPEFTYNAVKQGNKNKNTIFFLNVNTGEHRSIEAVGMKKVKSAFPSADGLTAIALDGDGNGLVIDTPF